MPMNLFAHYPTPDELDRYWAKAAAEVPADPQPTERRLLSAAPKSVPYDRHVQTEWLQFRGVDDAPFWCAWQRSSNRGASKTLIHLPGYGTEVSLHPFFCHEGYHVLHINPRGYCGPDGIDNAAWRTSDGWPDVMIHNLAEPDRYGYRAWIQDGLIAVRWILRQMEANAAEPGVLKNPLGFYGTSQGGGGALVLASVSQEIGATVGAVAADEPFLTGFELAYAKSDRGAYTRVLQDIDAEKDEQRRAQMARSIGVIDSHSHAHRMRYPVLLTAGGSDKTCPVDTIEALYRKLPATRSITVYEGMLHGHTFGFLRLAHAWFDLYL